MTKIKTFIKLKRKYIKSYLAQLENLYGLKDKFKTILSQLFDVCFTGIIIWYIITFRNFFSYGLISALTMYYVAWFIDKIKGTE